MSYGGYEYNERSFAGADPMGGFAGGFMPTTDDMDVKSSEKKNSRDRQTLIPLTVKQVLTAQKENEAFMVDNTELNMIKLMGVLTMKEEHSTSIVFQLRDGTDVIECKQWIEKGSSTYNKVAEIREGAGVRIVGNLREYENKLHILVYDITPVLDWNEFTYHILDTILIHLQNTKGPIPGTTSGHQPMKMSTPNKMGMGGVGLIGSASLNTVKNESEDLSEIVFETYRRFEDEVQGLKFQEAFRALQQQKISVTQQHLEAVVRKLCDEGRLYTTIDDYHHKTT